MKRDGIIMKSQHKLNKLNAEVTKAMSTSTGKTTLETFIMLFVVMGLILPIASYSAQRESIGLVVVAIGNVNKTTGNGPALKLAVNDHIYEGDEIKTGNHGYTKILLEDDTVIGLGHNTHFEFSSFKIASRKSRKARYNLYQGQARTLFTRKAEPGDIKIRTPDVIMDIRGTEIIATAYTIDGKTQTDISLLSGRLHVTFKDAAMDKRSMILERGEAINSKDFIQHGDQGTHTIDQKTLDSLKNEWDSFLPPLNTMKKRDDRSLIAIEPQRVVANIERPGQVVDEVSKLNELNNSNELGQDLQNVLSQLKESMKNSTASGEGTTDGSAGGNAGELSEVFNPQENEYENGQLRDFLEGLFQ